MDEEKKVPRKDYSVDEILAEARVMDTRKAEAAPESPPGKQAQPAPSEEDIVRSAREALDMEASETEGPGPDASGPEGGDPDRPKPGKKKWFSLFRRRKKRIPEFREEEDIYYGLQLKPLEEYRREYEKSILAEQEKENLPQEGESRSSFPYLFGRENGEPDPKIQETFERVHQERQKRLEKIMLQAGLDPDEVLEQEAAAQEPRPKPEQGPPPRQPAVQPGPVRKPEEKPPITEPIPMPPAAPQILTRAEPEQTEEAEEEKTKPPTGGPASPRPGRAGTPAGAEPQQPEQAGEESAKRESGAPKQEAQHAGAPKPKAEHAARTQQATVSGREAPAVRETAPLTAQEREPAPPVREPGRKPPQAKEELPPPPAVNEPGGRPPEYRAGAGLPLHVIRLEDFDEVLAREAQGYPPEEPRTQQPILFPQKETPPTGESAATKPGDLEKDGSDFPKISELRPAGSDLFGDAPTPEEAAQPKPEEPQAQKKGKSFRVFGSDEPENDPDDLPAPEPEELDDYTSPSDAPSVQHDLVSGLSKFLLRLAVTGISTFLLLVFDILCEHPAFLPPEVHILMEPKAYPILNGIFLTIAALFSFPVVLNGLRGLFTFQSNSDSGAAVAVIGSLVQAVVLLVLGRPAGIFSYCPLAAAALFLNAAGKVSMQKRILANFRYISSPGKKYAVRIYDDYNTALRLSKDCVLGEPRIAYQSEAGFLKHFLRLSYAPDPADHISQILAPVGFILSLVVCGVSVYLTRSAVAAVTVFAASACVCVPLANMLCVNLPLARLSRTASRCGSMMVGWPAVERYSDTNAVLVDAQDLFPCGTVILNGIKTFAGQRIDDAILDAAALMGTVGGPLADLFDQIIKSRRDILPKITEPAYRDGKGVTGVVSGRRILVGNRELLKEEGIEPPSRDYEDKYIRGGKRTVYLASGGTLVAMFIVSYRSDRRRALELRRAENNGISLIVRTSDPNITPLFLSECFGLDLNGTRVLEEPLGSVYTDLSSAPPDRTEAYLATKGHVASMLRMLSGCIRQRGNISIAVALQTAAAALGFALVAFLSCYKGLGHLSVTALTVFEAFWIAAVVLVPRIRRP